MRASELFAMFMEERKNTGLCLSNECRLANTHGAFIEEQALSDKVTYVVRLIFQQNLLTNFDDP